MQPDIDITDPLVCALTWLLTYLVGGYCPDRYRDKVRHALPAIALTIAVGLRAGYDATHGEPLTLDTLVRAGAAAGIAVLGHSQAREVAKVTERSEPAE